MQARDWFRSYIASSTFRLADLTPDILIASSFLPDNPPRDPVDRIIIATARENGLRIVTRDRLILDYASQGHIQAIAC